MYAVGSDIFMTRISSMVPAGAKLGMTWRRFSAEYLTKLAVGTTHQIRDVVGSPLAFSNAGARAARAIPGPVEQLRPRDRQPRHAAA